MWGRVRVGGGGDSAICLEGAHKPGERESVHHSSQVTVPCDFKIFKKQANLSCWGTSNHKAREESEEENTWAVGTPTNTDSPTQEAEELSECAEEREKTAIIARRADHM